MKKFFTIVGFLFSIAVSAQSGDAVTSALSEGNAAKFTSYFSNNVDVKFPQQNELKNLNKTEAASAVSKFFSSNNITGFEVTSQREMSGTMYIAGKLKGGSQNYNITVMLKNSGNDMAVITVRIS